MQTVPLMVEICRLCVLWLTDHRSCHEISQRMQALCAIKMPCSGTRQRHTL
jgi:hypothetical protein